MTANEDYLKTTLEKLEVDNKLKCQQFGSHIEESPERDPSPVPKPSPRIIRKTDEEKHSQIKVTPGVLYWQQPGSLKHLFLSQLPWGLIVTEPQS